MKTFLRLLGLLVLVVAGLALFVSLRGIPRYDAPAVTAAPAARNTPAQLELGEKIVRASCAECHLNRQTGRLSGHRLVDTPPEFGTFYSANITQDPAHGIGAWTDAEIVGAVRTGIGRTRHYLVIMPHFAHLSDDDMQAVLAFLHANHPMVQADPTPAPKQQPSFLLKVLTNTVMKPTPLLPEPLPTPAPTPALAYGQYLVTGRYVCFECHSKDHKSNNALHPEQSAGYLGGGTAFPVEPGQEIRSANITGDADTGIGDWTPAQLAAALRFGQGPHGPIRAPMPKYSTMTDEEVQGIYAYLQSVPKLKSEPKTK